MVRDTAMNRQQRRAALTRARRAEVDLRSQGSCPKARVKARRAFEIIKQASHTRVGTRTNLYSKCVDGVAVLGALQDRGIQETNPFHYKSPLGQ